VGRLRQFEPSISNRSDGESAQRRQSSSNNSFQDFVVASECRPMSALKVQRSAIPKIVADCNGSVD